MAWATQWLGAGCFHAVCDDFLLSWGAQQRDQTQGLLWHPIVRGGVSWGWSLKVPPLIGAASQLALFQLTALKGLKDRWNHGVGIWESQLFGAWIVTWLVGTWLWKCLQSPTHMKQLCRMASWVFPWHPACCLRSFAFNVKLLQHASTLTHRVDILHWQLQKQHLTVREIADYWEYFCQWAAQPLDVLCITVCKSQSLMAEIDALLCLDCSDDVVGASRMRLPRIYNRYAVKCDTGQTECSGDPFL